MKLNTDLELQIMLTGFMLIFCFFLGLSLIQRKNILKHNFETFINYINYLD
jgi:hypothetical protein